MLRETWTRRASSGHVLGMDPFISPLFTRFLVSNMEPGIFSLLPTSQGCCEDPGTRSCEGFEGIEQLTHGSFLHEPSQSRVSWG